jgi:uncharacterized protein (TIGR03435 family)
VNPLISSKVNVRQWALCAVAGWMMLGVACGWSETPDAAKPPAFDVISVKPDKSGVPNVSIRMTPDGFIATNITAHMLLMEGFGLNADQLSGEPAWASSAAFDVEAKVSGADVDAMKKISFDQRRSMFQQVLTDRFQLKVHHDSQQLPVYTLMLAKGGSKLKQTVTDAKGPGGLSGGPGRIMIGRGSIKGEGMTVEFLISILSRQLHRTVVDKTGLTGNYDFELKWTPDEGIGGDAGAHGGPAGDDPSASGPTLFTALQEQLGLKLESGKGPVDVVVIDHIEKPAEN